MSLTIDGRCFCHDGVGKDVVPTPLCVSLLIRLGTTTRCVLDIVRVCIARASGSGRRMCYCTENDLARAGIFTHVRDSLAVLESVLVFFLLKKVESFDTIKSLHALPSRM
jgi:hypothetical protein